MSLPVMFYGRHGETCPLLGEWALETKALTVRYPEARLDALQGIDLTIPSGVCVAVVGHNGAGKSTLLQAIAGMLPISSGTMQIYGHASGSCHHRVAYLSQRSTVEWQYPTTVRELVMTGRYVHLGWFRAPRRQDWEIVENFLSELGLADLGGQQIGRLSGGQQQRMLLARALAQEAQLLLLDEPLNSLDQESRRLLSRTFYRLKKAGKTLLVSTHDHDDVDAEFDRIVLLSEGRVLESSAMANRGSKTED